MLRTWYDFWALSSPSTHLHSLDFLELLPFFERLEVGHGALDGLLQRYIGSVPAPI